MRNDLPNDPAVYKLASTTQLDRFAVIGRLYAFWSWADKHAVDGRVDGAPSQLVDDVVQCPGFAAALVAVKWLEVGEDFVALPKFERHNGESAKERGLKNARQARWREAKTNLSTTPELVDGAPSTTPSTREEKRREEKNTPLPPAAPSAPPRGRGIAEGKPSERLPTTDQSRRIAAMFRRQATTPWTEKEVSAYRKLGTFSEADLSTLEAYYAAERAKGDDGIHRRDLSTFLNNFAGELDRARAWQETAGKAKSASTGDPDGWREWLASLPQKPAYMPFATATPFLKDDFREHRRATS